MNIAEPQGLISVFSNQVDALQIGDSADAIVGQLKHAAGTGN